MNPYEPPEYTAAVFPPSVLDILEFDERGEMHGYRERRYRGHKKTSNPRGSLYIEKHAEHLYIEGVLTFQDVLSLAEAIKSD